MVSLRFKGNYDYDILPQHFPWSFTISSFSLNKCSKKSFWFSFVMHAFNSNAVEVRGRQILVSLRPGRSTQPILGQPEPMSKTNKWKMKSLRTKRMMLQYKLLNSFLEYPGLVSSIFMRHLRIIYNSKSGDLMTSLASVVPTQHEFINT